ncbi:MAG: hypothetical protein ACNA8W_15035 [Bradymonadaceae bacterium]
MKRFLPIAILLIACTTPPDPSERVGAETPTEPEAEARPAEILEEARPWDRDGLEAQPRQAALARDTPEEMEFSPGTTDWRPSVRKLPEPMVSPLPDGPTSPGALLNEVTRELGFGDGLGEEVWEMTTRVWQEDEDSAVGMILQWGFKDDSVAGSDVRLTMRRSDQTWTIEELEERFHCRRGVSEDLCL